jgi:F-type H+-transporting ATPase subunit b
MLNLVRYLAIPLFAMGCLLSLERFVSAADTKEVAGEVTKIAEAVGHDEHDHDSHGKGGHEPHDPTHSFAGKMQGNPMEFRSDGAIFSLIVFLCLLAVLGIFAWKPIAAGLADREATIAKSLEDAKKAADMAAASMKEYQAKIATAQTEAATLLSDARKTAESAGQRILAEAKAEAERQRDRALSDIEAAKQAALSDLAGKSTDMAFGLARRVVGRELNVNDHQKLIQEALEQMPSRN